MPQIVKDQHHCKYRRHWLMSHVGPLPSRGLSECSVFRHESSAYWGTGQQFFSNFSINVTVHYGWHGVWVLAKLGKRRGNKCDLAKFDNAIYWQSLVTSQMWSKVTSNFSTALLIRWCIYHMLNHLKNVPLGQSSSTSCNLDSVVSEPTIHLSGITQAFIYV